MKIYESIVLGILQGISEFLPISSSGHLLLLEKLGVGVESMFFNIMVHVATLVAVLIATRKEWMPLARHPFNKLNGYIILSCLPTISIAILFKAFCPSLLDGTFLGCGFMLTAIFLFIGERLQIAKSKVYNAKISILSGVLQGIAVLPGVSRSGATISTMNFLGVEKERATNISFLMSIPIIIGSTLLEVVEMCVTNKPIDVDVICVILGMTSAFLSGFLSIKFLLKLIKRYSFAPFIIYTFLLGIAVSVLQIVGII